MFPWGASPTHKRPHRKDSGECRRQDSARESSTPIAYRGWDWRAVPHHDHETIERSAVRSRVLGIWQIPNGWPRKLVGPDAAPLCQFHLWHIPPGAVSVTRPDVLSILALLAIAAGEPSTRRRLMFL